MQKKKEDKKKKGAAEKDIQKETKVRKKGKKNTGREQGS